MRDERVRAKLVYGLVDPQTLEIRYVGQTSQGIRQRLYQHRAGVKRGYTHHLYSWLRSLAEPPTLVVLAWEPDDLDEAERYWMHNLRVQGARLCNSREGGSNGAHSLKTRALLAAIGTGKKHSPETRAKMSAAHKGLVRTAEHRAHLSAALKGQIIPPAARAKMSAAHLGHHLTISARAKLSASMKISRATKKYALQRSRSQLQLI